MRRQLGQPGPNLTLSVALLAPLLALLLIPLAAIGTASAAPVTPLRTPQSDAFWSPTDARPSNTRPRAVSPRSAATYSLDRDALAARLATAPPSEARARRTPLTVTVPAPDGTLVDFDVVETSVMAPALASAHPEIRTYAGSPSDGSADSIRIDVSPYGFHASVLGEHGAWYVDPAYIGDDSLYLSYERSDLPAPSTPMTEPDAAASPARTSRAPRAGETAGAAVQHRTFRLALVSDPNYAEYFAPGDTESVSDSKVLAAKTTLMNRVNQIYTTDLGITLQMVAGTDTKLNLRTSGELTAAGYSTATVAGGCDGPLLDQTSTALDNLIGEANFDIGHIALGINGGGLAALGVVGVDHYKSQGCTGLPEPIGDFFAVDYVAHEIGHQFGGDHTFNSCDGNREAAAAVEPGSGSSVMAYAGICGSDDLQPHTDPYFSQRTIEQVTGYLTGGGFSDMPAGTGTTTTSSNHAPSVAAPADKSIPKRTPFALTAAGNDTDGDTLVYSWEQNDLGTESALTSNAKASGPLFRIFGDYASPTDPFSYNSPGENHASTSPTRVLPDMAQILARETNAETGSCPAAATGAPLPDGPALDCYSEFLPTSARTLNFRVTARDLDPVAGGTAYDDVKLMVTGAGPLLVTSQSNPGTSYSGGSDQTVSWNVNGTNAAALARNVRITLSTDGGATFDQILAASTPNDGTQSVTLPNLDTDHARIKVEAVDNYFFAVNDTEFSVTAQSGPLAVTSSLADATIGNGDSVADQSISATSDDGEVQATASGLPNGLELTRTAGTPSGIVPSNATWALSGVVNDTPGTYPIDIEITDGISTVHRGLILTISEVAPVAPETTVDGGPANDELLLTRSAVFELGSDASDATFTCTLDQAAVPCAAGEVLLNKLKGGTHVFTAAATSGGLTDPTPATRTFTVPAGHTEIQRTGKWKRPRSAGAFDGRMMTSKSKGAKLRYRAKDVTRVGVIFRTSKRGGTMKVSFGGRTKRVNTSHKSGRYIVWLKTFSTPRSGPVVIKVVSKRRIVKIEGIVPRA